ncbi:MULTISPECIES: universal stress protein [unclassified Arthrobacter]|uniref:universal stress protein n=1 Tax=unclassified Arthrobacter TaxID=235627 RepID=UPI001D142B2C|nr:MULTISPECIES: universal stress protein [unclassified Arthrobacter]MCC3274755.1 universal stress protein [Arthrobacter sp. zg-Y20]MCC3279276.1 universal stress protein [Arthrobacter sp. zg-Y40]MCC9177652.1 universal stress protein [Arthrobacter sp. zg-Y750]MDK1314911.1 universal stress protein [Arthrobacter sp. zg.Y20]MDK1327772.1 universal stress protein [Arthrobacter sp. zg-Y1143]
MTVVVGYVPTPEGETALRAGVRAARELAMGLVVVNVESTRGARDPGESPGYLQELATVLQESRLPHTLLHPVGDFDASEEILKAAEGHGAQLVVLGIRHRTPVGKLFLGSTAQRVLLEADCPVLAVKAGQA